MTQIMTITHFERRGLRVALNLADGHVRRRPTKAEIPILENLQDIYAESLQCSAIMLERLFVEALMKLHGQTLPQEAAMVFFSGSEALSAIGAALRSKGYRVAVIEPTFDNIPALIALAGVEVTALAEDSLADLDSLPAALYSVDGLVLTLPNNPTGYAMGSKNFARVAEICADNACALVVDASFRAYAADRVDHYAILEAIPDLDWMVLEDTGKLWAANDLKAGILHCSARMRPAASSVFHNLVLSISPFVLNLQRHLAERAGRIAVNEIISVIRHNRIAVRERLRDHPIFATDASVTDLPVERLFYDPAVFPDQQRLINDLLLRDVATTGSEGYFWAGGKHRPFIRLALSRDIEVIRAALDVLCGSGRVRQRLI